MPEIAVRCHPTDSDSSIAGVKCRGGTFCREVLWHCSAFRERARTRKVSGRCQGSDTLSLFSARGCARVREACELIDLL